MKRRLGKPLLILVIIGLLVAGIGAFFVLNSTPDQLTDEQKEKAVADILGRKPNLNPDIKTGNVEFDGEKLSFSYPAKAVIYEYKSPGMANDATLEDSFSFDIENPRLVLNYTAKSKTALSKLTDEPAVKLREQESRGYTKEEIEVGGVSGLGFKKEGGGGDSAEHSAFILKDGILYTISITGASLKDVDKLFDQIIESASFK